MFLYLKFPPSLNSPDLHFEDEGGSLKYEPKLLNIKTDQNIETSTMLSCFYSVDFSEFIIEVDGNHTANYISLISGYCMLVSVLPGKMIQE